MRMLKFMVLSALTLAVGLAADHPLIISGGSPLRIQHDSWAPQDDQTLASAAKGGTVTRVEISTNAGSVETIFFNGEKLELSLSYGSIGVTVTTDDKGHNPVLKLDSKTSLKQHFHKVDDATFESVSAKGSFKNLTLTKGGTAQKLGKITGHTEITVHYE